MFGLGFMCEDAWSGTNTWEVRQLGGSVCVNMSFTVVVKMTIVFICVV